MAPAPLSRLLRNPWTALWEGSRRSGMRFTAPFPGSSSGADRTALVRPASLAPRYLAGSPRDARFARGRWDCWLAPAVCPELAGVAVTVSARVAGRTPTAVRCASANESGRPRRPPTWLPLVSQHEHSRSSLPGARANQQSACRCAIVTAMRGTTERAARCPATRPRTAQSLLSL